MIITTTTISSKIKTALYVCIVYCKLHELEYALLCGVRMAHTHRHTHAGENKNRMRLVKLIEKCKINELRVRI